MCKNKKKKNRKNDAFMLRNIFLRNGILGLTELNMFWLPKTLLWSWIFKRHLSYDRGDARLC